MTKKDLTAIIIAGGRGERLMPLTQYIPKSLITVTKDHKTIMDKQIEAMRANPEISDIVFITGYRAKDIDKKIKGYNDPRIRTIFDPYTISNLLGLWCARNEMDKDFIITNGDNIFKSTALSKLIQTGDGINLLISKKDIYDNGDMKVSVYDGKITKVSKEIIPSKIYAESVSTVKVQGKEARDVWRNGLDELVREIGYKDDSAALFKKKFWTEIFNKIAKKRYPISYVEISQKEWKEFDFHPNAEVIKKMILDYRIEMNLD